MIIKPETTIGEIVAKNYKYASIFQKLQIDFCCNGQVTLQEACQQNDLNFEEIKEALIEVKNDYTHELADFNLWPINLLADYIQRKHHNYVEKKTNLINNLLEKLCQVHGESHPELFKIQEIFRKSGKDLAAHMKKEELMLFPLVKKMIQAKEDNITIQTPLFGNISQAIAQMHTDHQEEGKHFRQIREMSNDLTPPEDACNTYQVTFHELVEFEKDLHLHIHLENNILFPKAIALEEELKSSIH